MEFPSKFISFSDFILIFHLIFCTIVILLRAENVSPLFLPYFFISSRSFLPPPVSLFLSIKPSTSIFSDEEMGGPPGSEVTCPDSHIELLSNREREAQRLEVSWIFLLLLRQPLPTVVLLIVLLSVCPHPCGHCFSSGLKGKVSPHSKAWWQV